MMAATKVVQNRFVRRTSLNSDEYRKHFRQIDSDVIDVLTSDEASRVTPQMSKIYLSLVNTPSQYWEREGVLRFAGCEMEGDWHTAWQQLVELVGVASATARKAFQWMAEQGIIGYYAGKNGVGIRIFINRAASSIGQKPHQAQKNLRLIRTSTSAPRTSTVEAGFKESFADIENLELDSFPQSPQNGAAEINSERQLVGSQSSSQDARAINIQIKSIDSNEIVERIARQVLSQVRSAAAREQERTREWFINYALPKAIRVAQASAYDVLRAHGHINDHHSRNGGRNHHSDRQIGKHTPTEITPRLLSDEEVDELAESCVALLVTQGQTLDRSLCEMSVEAGGFLLLEDAPKIRSRAEDLIRAGTLAPSDGREGNGS